MSPRRPRSTLFPYTTLFRSAGADSGRPWDREQAPWSGPLWQTTRQGEQILEELQVLQQRPEITLHRSDPALAERSEEPRLNSSHSQISYAVFCLKKKNKR